MKTVTYTVPNISCGHCVHTIKTEVSEIEGVEYVEATVPDQKVVIRFENPASEKQIVDLMTEIAYPPVIS